MKERILGALVLFVLGCLLLLAIEIDSNHPGLIIPEDRYETEN
jgi:hypothetical protein